MTNDLDAAMERRAAGKLGNEKGFTLAELMVVTGIFVIIMIITSKAFDRLLSTGSQQARTSVSSIDGIVGLEMMRRDLTHAGYGLPWTFQFTPATAFPEVSGAPASNLGVTPSDLNEITPHPLTCVTVGASGTNPGTDYLAIKSAMLPLTATNSSVGRWGYLNYAMNGTTPASYIQRVNDPTSDVRSGTDRVITIAASIGGDGSQRRQLLNTTATDFFYTPPDNYVAPLAYQATDSNNSYLVYAIADRTPRMPWNRADYYINRPAANDANFKIPSSCNPGTGILFKAVADHTGGYTKPYPLLNCVADMKVVYTLDPNNDGNLSYAPAASSLLSPDDLRAQLRNVTVYILAQEGKKDPNYTYPTDSIFVGPMVGATQLVSVGKVWQKSELDARYPGWKNYRWKVYAIPVTPKNMQK